MPSPRKDIVTFCVAAATTLGALVFFAAPLNAQPQLVRNLGHHAYRLFLLGQMAGMDNDHRAAIDFYRRALDAEPGSAAIYQALAEEYLAENQLPAAAQTLKGGLALSPDHVPLLLLHGKVLAAQNKPQEAERSLRRALALDRKREESHLALFQLHLGRQDFNAAEADLRQLVETIPGSYRGHYYLGRIYVEKGEYELARQSYAQAVELAPHWIYGWYALGLLLDHLGQREEALRAMNEVLALDPENAQIISAVGMLELALAHFDAAAAAFLQLYQKTGDTQHLLRAALIYLQGKEPQRALALLQSLETMYPKEAGIHFYYALVREQEGDKLGTLFHLQQLPPRHELYLEARLKMSQLLEEAGQLDEAGRRIEEALAALPDNESLYLRLAAIEEQRGQPAAAEATFQRGLRRAANPENLLYQFGSFYERQGRTDEAIAQMRRLLEKNPHNASALNFIGFSFAERGQNLGEAQRLIERALALRPGDGYIIDSLGWLYFKRGDWPRAVATLDEASHKSPDEPVIMEHLADACLSLGRQWLQQAQQNPAADKRLRSALQRKLAPGFLQPGKTRPLDALERQIAALEKERPEKGGDPRTAEQLGEAYLHKAQTLYEKALDISRALSQKDSGETARENRQAAARLQQKLAELYAPLAASAPAR